MRMGLSRGMTMAMRQVDGVRSKSSRPSISFANTSATVAGVAEGLRLVGTFGATFGDVIKFVDASATVCDADAALASLTASDGTQSLSLNVDGTAAYDDNDAALTIDALFAALALEAAARGGAGEIAFATAEPGLSATTGSARRRTALQRTLAGTRRRCKRGRGGGASQFTAAMAWRLCARFGDATTGVWYGPLSRPSDGSVRDLVCLDRRVRARNWLAGGVLIYRHWHRGR